MTCIRHTFTDEEWKRITLLLPPCKGRPGGTQRTFFNAMLWMARTSAAWRDLSERLCKWSAVYKHYAYWYDKGYIKRFFQGVQQTAMHKVIMDLACCNAHQASVGAQKTSCP
jgi:transposase